MADDAPATKQDIRELGAELKAAIEKVETTLLSEFWKWARTNDIKVAR